MKTALINESRVREAARSEGLSVTGTLGIILRAYNSHTLSKRKTLAILSEIKRQEGEFRIHPKIVENAMETLKENPKARQTPQEA